MAAREVGNGPPTTGIPRVLNVKDYRARGDGTTDDTSAVAAAYAAASAAGGGVLFFPEGDYKFNLTVDADNITLEGVGPGNVNTGSAATKFIPANYTTPLIQFGAGTTRRYALGLRNCQLVGDGATATSDGLLIKGCQDVAIDGVNVTGFGRDNVRIESTAAATTFAIWFSNFHTSAARRCGFRADYGAGFVTAVYFANCHFNGWTSASAYSIYVDGVQLGLANCYVDIPASLQGHVYLAKSGSTTPILNCVNSEFDNAGGGAAVSIEVPFTTYSAGKYSRYVRGTYAIAGSVKFSDATTATAGMFGGANSNSWLEAPMSFGSLGFPLDEAGASSGSADVNIARSGAAGSATLAVSGVQNFNIAGGQINALICSAAIQPVDDDGTTAQSGKIYMGSGAPSNGNGNNGDFYFRTDTPGTANQRLYVKSGGSWTGIV